MSAPAEHEVEHVLARIAEWAGARHDVRAVALVGSWARGEAREDSDVDIVLLTDDVAAYTDADEWVRELGGTAIVRTGDWGVMTERRFALPSGLEVEVGVGPATWASTDPVDAGTRRVVETGFRILYDPHGLLAQLGHACLSSRG